MPLTICIDTSYRYLKNQFELHPHALGSAPGGKLGLYWASACAPGPWVCYRTWLSHCKLIINYYNVMSSYMYNDIMS